MGKDRRSAFIGARDEFAASASGGVTPVEGAFVPTLTTSTGTVTLGGATFGKYMQLGTFVFAAALCSVTAVAAPTGGFFIRTHAPAALNPATNNLEYPIALFLFGLTAAANPQAIGLVIRDPGGPIIQVQSFTAGTTVDFASAIQNGTQIYVSGSWMTSA